MLVDSNLERRTLDELRRLQRWLCANKGVRLEIEKPHFDIAGEDAAAAPATAPREPYIPDFIVRAEDDAARGARTVLVETMGYADEIYRSRKHVMHDLMEHVARAPVVLHDFHFPDDVGAQWESFVLSNVVPQNANDNRYLWADIEFAVRGLVLGDGDSVGSGANSLTNQRSWL